MNSRVLKVVGILLVVVLIGGGSVYIIRVYENYLNSQLEQTPSGQEACDSTQTTYTIRIQLLDSISEEPVTGGNVTILDGGTAQTYDCIVVATPPPINTVTLNETSDGKYTGAIIGNDKLQLLDVIIEANGYKSRELHYGILSGFVIFREIRMSPTDR